MIKLGRERLWQRIGEVFCNGRKGFLISHSVREKKDQENHFWKLFRKLLLEPRSLRYVNLKRLSNQSDLIIVFKIIVLLTIKR